jgi:glycerate 2-kinase
MNILIAPDAFKDSLSAMKVADAIESGVRRYSKEFSCFQLFASDGGEGFLNAVQGYISGLNEISVDTFDPLGRPIQATYLWDVNLAEAYIELAKASGIELLSLAERDPIKTSTYGTGLQVRHAIEKGAKRIFIGIGGSATNDGGMGIARALGYRFLDKHNKELSGIGADLKKVQQIISPSVPLKEIEFFAVNDVLNPLCGKTGAAYTYGAQKGASMETIRWLDEGLQNLSGQIVKVLNKDEATTPGSGAAGGAAYGLKCFFEAKFISGTSFILNLSNFHELLTKHNIKLIITGEGKIDHQTAYGKFVYGIIQEASKYKIPVVAICGKLNLNQEEIAELGLAGAAELYDPTKSTSYSFDHAEELIELTTMQLLQSIS